MELVCIFGNIVTLKKKQTNKQKITVEWESFVDIVGMKRDFKDYFYVWSFAAFRTSLDVRKGESQSCALCEWFAEWWMLSSYIQHSMNELEMQIFHSNYLLSRPCAVQSARATSLFLNSCLRLFSLSVQQDLHHRVYSLWARNIHKVMITSEKTSLLQFSFIPSFPLVSILYFMVILCGIGRSI